MPIVYSFRRCPYAIRARLALIYAGIDYELREVDLKSKPDHMIALSPKATVPVLLLDDGTVIDESLGIMEWALAQNDPEDWAVAEGQSHPLIIRNDTEFTAANHRYKYTARFPEDSLEENREKAEAFIISLEQQFEDRDFLIAEKPTMIDAALFPFVRQFAKVDGNWFATRPYPKIQTWLEYFYSSEIFAAAMIKQDIWHDG